MRFNLSRETFGETLEAEICGAEPLEASLENDLPSESNGDSDVCTVRRGDHLPKAKRKRKARPQGHGAVGKRS